MNHVLISAVHNLSLSSTVR